MDPEQGEGGSEESEEWVDPRYAYLVEEFDRARARAGRPLRFFLYDPPGRSSSA
ncbi:hypothetical protein [Streptomyces sp. RFCAC02]|uniref:hypothetical protein n=1 Tax=Streptomyces sp. RFCAC02 TaxID=2499143 RepID=UPI00143DF916|nr:hypothetical protein [Streptomyces sp. RFCAC02]